LSQQLCQKIQIREIKNDEASFGSVQDMKNQGNGSGRVMLILQWFPVMNFMLD
jgi:hypothetical protein